MNFTQLEFDFKEKNMTQNETNVVETPVETDVEEFDDTSDCIEVETSDEEDVSSIEINQKGEWKNKRVVPVEKINCYIPLSLYNAIKNIEACVNKKFSCKNEFSIYIHGEYDEEGDIIVSEDYYIPKQKVGIASVDYVEEPDPYYNGCLHKHPDGCLNFSGVDAEYINSNFEFSLLYVRKEIRLGIVNIKYHPARRIQVGLNIHVGEEEVESVDIENIMKFETPKPNFQQKVETPKMLLPGFESQNEIILPSVYNPANQQDDVPQNPSQLDSEFASMFPGF